MLATGLNFSRFEMPVSVQVYRHRKIAYVKNLARTGNVIGLCGYLLKLGRLGDWLELGKKLFDSVSRWYLASVRSFLGAG
jgi:hypothetical protein